MPGHLYYDALAITKPCKALDTVCESHPMYLGRICFRAYMNVATWVCYGRGLESHIYRATTSVRPIMQAVEPWGESGSGLLYYQCHTGVSWVGESGELL